MGLFVSDVVKGVIRDYESIGFLILLRSILFFLNYKDNDVFFNKVEYVFVRNVSSVLFEFRFSWLSFDSERFGGEKRLFCVSVSYVLVWYKDM